MKMLILAGLLLLSQPLHAADGSRYLKGSHDSSKGYDSGTSAGGTNPDVMVNMPPEAWTQEQNNQPPCLRCCIYENRSYTEGSVVKMEGVLLQCARDEKSYGTNNLTWQIVK